MQKSDDIKINKISVVAVLLLWLIWFLSIIGQSLFSDIPDRIYEQFGVMLGYKILLIICSFLLVATASLLILYFSKHVKKIIPAIEKSIDKNQPQAKPTFIWVSFYKLLWKGSVNDGNCDPMPYCPDHKLQLFYSERRYTCPTCGSDKLLWLDYNTRTQLANGANSLLRGMIDNENKIV